jgi:outer membrane protein TolC
MWARNTASAIFYLNEEQKRVALSYIKQINEAKTRWTSKHPRLVLQFIVMKHNQHEIARMKELEANKLKAKAADNNFWPDISLYGRYDYYGSNTNSMDSTFSDIRETSYAAGILINIPLFDGGVRMWERKRNMHEVRRHEENVKAVIEEKADYSD